MKHHLLASSCFSLFVLAACSRSLKQADVPQAVRTAVESKFPGLSYKWEKEDRNYEANFKKDAISMSMVIDVSGTILSTETAIPVSDLPAGILAYMKTHYNGKNIRDAARIVNADGSVVYEAALKEKDVLFDSNGNFLKEEED
jgi:hypothetical protein